jgi:hypothetical protein
MGKAWQSFVNEVRSSEQVRSELNPLSEESGHALAPGFELVVVV